MLGMKKHDSASEALEKAHLLTLEKKESTPANTGEKEKDTRRSFYAQGTQWKLATINMQKIPTAEI